ncbi:MAG: hypothetical protein V1738_01265 [Patescibacteria group bacterium]
MTKQQTSHARLLLAAAICRGLGLMTLAWPLIFRALTRYGSGGYEWLIRGPGIWRYFGGVQFQLAWWILPLLFGVAWLVTAKVLRTLADNAAGVQTTPSNRHNAWSVRSWLIDFMLGLGLTGVLTAVALLFWHPTKLETLAWLSAGPFPINQLADAADRPYMVGATAAVGIALIMLWRFVTPIARRDNNLE